MHRRWIVRRTNPEYISYLARATGVSAAMAQVLVNRGVKTPGEVELFASQSLEQLSDPYGMDGMEALVGAVQDARKNGTAVFVHGDYDADGLTATSIVVGALRLLGVDVRYFIPNRFSDGYGFHPPSVEMAKSTGAGLIITVDCGVTSFDAAEAARAAAIDLIITDHHEAASEQGSERPRLPAAKAVINPKLNGNTPVEGLSGAGIALKIVQALSEREPGLFSLRDYLDLAAIGTLADSVPLTGENRTIVKEGLAAINETEKAGLKALKSAAGIGSRPLRAGLVAFTLVPRINAAGRLDDATEVVELMLTESEKRAKEIAASLNSKNAERQKIEEAVTAEAEELLGRKPRGSAIVLCREGWHEGVLGIVASRIAEKHSRPAFVLTVKDGMAKGSARSIPGFDIHAGLSAVARRLVGFGGHKQAAGLRLKLSDLEDFEREIDALVASRMSDLTPTLSIDATVDLKDVTFRLAREIETLEPFGHGNPEPVFGSKGLEAINPRVVGNNHLKVKLRSANCAHDAIGWGMGDLLEFVQDAGQVDAAFSVTINEWERGRDVQLSLKGIRKADNGGA